jgi:hypothetical protein
VAPSTTITLEFFKELDLDSQRAKKPFSKHHLHSINYAAKLVHIPDAYFPVLLSTPIRSRFQVKPATLLIPIGLFLILLVEELYSTKVAPFP